jgi:hypothetical protein
MPKEIYCAKCGQSLRQGKQVVKGRILNIIFPHDCGGLNQKLLDELKELRMIEPEENEFVQKLNDLRPDSALRDRREPEHTRKEINFSSAPDSIQSRFSLGPKTKPDSVGGGQTAPDENEVSDG